MELLIITLAVLFALVAWMNFPKAILIVIALLPSYLLRANFFSVPTTLLEIMIIIVFVIFLLNQARGKKLHSCHSPFRSRKWLFPIGMLALATTIGIFIAPDKLQAIGVWKAYFIEPILFSYVLLSMLCSKKIQTEQVFTSLGISALIVSLVAIAQFITGAGIPIPWDNERRVTGVFDYPNAVGLYLGPIIIIAMAHLLQKRDAFWVTVVTLSITATVLAKSEAAIVAIITTFILMLFYNKPFRRLSLILASVCIVAILAFPTLQQKLFLQDYSGQVRLSQWSETLTMLKDKTIFGAGMSGYKTALAPYHLETRYEIFQYPHNIFLNVWTELGLLGLLAIILIVINMANLKSHPWPLAVIFIHGLVDVPFFKNDLAVLTIILIVLFVYSEYEQRKKT